MSALKAFLLLSLCSLSAVTGTPLAKASSATTLEARAVPHPQDGTPYLIVSCGGDFTCANPQNTGIGTFPRTRNLIQVGLPDGSHFTWTFTATAGGGGATGTLSIDNTYTGSNTNNQGTPVFATEIEAEDMTWTLVPVMSPDQTQTSQIYMIQADGFTDYVWRVNPKSENPNTPEIVFDYIQDNFDGQLFQLQTPPATA